MEHDEQDQSAGGCLRSRPRRLTDRCCGPIVACDLGSRKVAIAKRLRRLIRKFYHQILFEGVGSSPTGDVLLYHGSSLADNPTSANYTRLEPFWTLW